MELTRRSFLGMAGVAGLAAGASLAGCAPAGGSKDAGGNGGDDSAKDGTASKGASKNAVAGSAWLVNSVCTLAVFLAAFLLSRRLAPLMERKGVVVFVAVSLAAGVVLLLAGNLALRSPACNYAGNALVALGATPMIIMWGEL